MNATYAIARRELAEKRFVFAAALAFAVLALIMPFLGRPDHRLEALTVTSAIFSVGFALGLATILGATVIGKELGDNRLSFYFARPVPVSSIWFGKLLASAVLIGVSFAIIATPALLGGIGTMIRGAWVPNTMSAVGTVFAAAMVLFFVAHVLEPWFVPDLHGSGSILPA